MKKMAKILLIGLGFGLLVAVLGFLTSKPAPAQLPPPAVPVKVTNTPLPVQGTVSANVTNTVPVSGTVNANVTNSVLPVSGAVTATITNTSVPVSGTVNANFSNTSTTPLFTDTDGPARSGVAASCSAQLTGGHVECTLASVPLGKILVIEAVSCVVQVNAGADTPIVSLLIPSNFVAGGGASNFLYDLPMQHVATYPGIGDRYGFTSPMTIYAVPGDVALLGVGGGQAGATLPSALCTISGHLVST